jgi:ATP-binding cassette, subfamily B, bacterial
MTSQMPLPPTARSGSSESAARSSAMACPVGSGGEPENDAPSSRSEASISIPALLRPHAKALVLALCGIIGGAISNLLQPWPLKIVIDVVSGSKPLHGWLGHIVHTNLGHHKMARVEFAALALVAIAIFGAASSFAEDYMTSSVGQQITFDLRRIVYSHVQHLSLRYHKQKDTGDLISRLTTDIDAVQSFVVSGVMGVVVDCITLAGMAGVMFYLNRRFTLIALTVAPVLFGLSYSLTRRSKKDSREVRKRQSAVASMMQEDLSAIGVIKAFAQEEYAQRRLEEGGRESMQMALRARSMKATLSPLIDITVAIGTALVLWTGGRLVLGGSLTAGSLIVFIWYLGKMYKPMQDFARMTDSYAKAAVGYERIREVVNLAPDVCDLPSAQIAPRFSGQIEFNSVSFSYNSGEPVLKDISFKAEAGQVVAIVGPTGAGKSTIAAMIARLYDPESGSVRIDAQDVRKFAQQSLRNQISFVLQENILFRASICDNIAFGKPTATRAEIQRAAELADAQEFISNLPNGLDTIVGERGDTLSGGQRQRIAIARAIIRNAPILIMDEPSSGLDALSEKAVFDALGRLMKNTTSVVIAHRLSTIQHADIILVVNEGRIVERGRHEELWKLKGLYARLYQLQSMRDNDFAFGAA